MIATLPMYTNAVTKKAYARIWRAVSERLRAAGVDAPDSLTVLPDSEEAWLAPDLVLSQTCGYPYASRLRGKVRLVATPHYNVEGCAGPHYSSWIIANANSDATSLSDLRGLRAAVNGPGSQSGYNSFRAVIAPLAHGENYFSQVVTTGSHLDSMRAVATGAADCAAVDAVSWTLSLEAESGLGNRLRQLCATPLLPGLPFVTAGTCSDDDLETIREALHTVIADPASADDCATVRLVGVSHVPDDAYDACLRMEEDAIAQGYPILA